MNPMRKWKSQLVLRVLLLASVISISFIMWALKNSLNPPKLYSKLSNVSVNVDTSSKPLFHQRLVHLDLKGAPPKLSYLSELLVQVKKLGGTGFLIEYEDVFPYVGDLSLLSAENAYRRDDLEKFLRLCAFHNMAVIPLVQTFDHLEYALKFKEFEHLREDPLHPGVLCASNNVTKDCIERLLNQTIEFHSGVPIHLTHIHIGGEGFSQTPICPHCKMARRSQLYAEHLTTVHNIVQTHWPELKIILWVDNVDSFGQHLLKLYNGGKGTVQPMIRSLSTSEGLNMAATNLHRGLWADSIFKGRIGSYQILPSLAFSLSNVYTWLDAVSTVQKGFQGIILTGPQKLNHFAGLYELLPASIPSLFLSLVTANNSVSPEYDNYIRMTDGLNCSSNRRFEYFDYYDIALPLVNCSYFGQTTYEMMVDVHNHITKGRKLTEELQYEMAVNGFASVTSQWVNKTRKTCLDNIAQLKSAAQMLHEGLKDIYDTDTIGIYIQQNIFSIIQQLQDVLREINNAPNLVYWPRKFPELPQQIQDLFKSTEKPEASTNISTNISNVN